MAESPLLAGQNVVVTGGTGGLGKATAMGLASLGARVGIVGRDRARAEAAAEELRRGSGNDGIDVFEADLSAQAEVRRLAAEIQERYPRLDVLVNNVGGFWAHRHDTADGLELTFALNHLASFLLTHLLVDRMIAQGRAASTSTICREPDGTPASAPTTSPSWPTCSSRMNSPVVWVERRSPRTRCTPVSRARRSARRIR